MLFTQVNSIARCAFNSAARKVPDMGKRKALETWQLEDADRLKKLYDERVQVSQATFANDSGIGTTQGSVWQYLAGKIPLNMEVLLKFCVALKAKAVEISPTLAKPLQEYQTKIVGEAADAKASDDAIEIALAFDKMSPQTQEASRHYVFLMSVMDKTQPWLRVGRPVSHNYGDFEEWHLNNMQAQVTLEAARIGKPKE